MALDELGKHVRLGNIQMVRFFLHSGTDIGGSPHRIPLSEACKRAQDDVVDLFLERSSDPNLPCIPDSPGESKAWIGGLPPNILRVRRSSSAVSMAAKAGSLSILQKLIDHGADLSRCENGSHALSYAVENEHEEMVRLLLGCDKLRCLEPQILYSARQDGLGSMVDLLEAVLSKP